ncbi:PTS glucose transporter subunit IIA [Actinomadura keratinilytica]
MTEVMSPLSGQAIGLASVPDPVFSGAMVGPGTAIDPVREPSEAVSPVAGVVVSLHPHAFVVVDEAGRGVLTHLGIDTVQLNGEGFELLVRKGTPSPRGSPWCGGTPPPSRPPASRPSARWWHWRRSPTSCPVFVRMGTWRRASRCSAGTDRSRRRIPAGDHIQRGGHAARAETVRWRQRCEASA